MDNNKKIKYQIQTFGITFSTIIAACFHSILGYISIYFFKPLWEKIVKWWNNE